MAVIFTSLQIFGSLAPLGAHNPASSMAVRVPLLSTMVNCNDQSICSHRDFKLRSIVVKSDLLCRAIVGEAGERVEEDDGSLLGDSAGASLENAEVSF